MTGLTLRPNSYENCLFPSPHAHPMTPDRIIRSALWTSVGFNLLGVAVFLPAALGRPAWLLPIVAPPFYAAQLGMVIALFGGVYAWLARQAEICRPLVVVGALGKLGFFLLFVVYWATGDMSARGVAQATPDLVLAAFFLWWVRVSRSDVS